jgi:aminoglycoside phosphotransferase (APT) family kinase protein
MTDLAKVPQIMIAPATPALDQLTDRLQPYLTGRLQQPVQITALKLLIGGACQDNFAIDLQIGDQPSASYVLRTDKGKALAASLNRVDEYGVMAAAYQAGVKTPQPFLLEPSPTVIGHPFYLMARISGTAIARKVLSDPTLAEARLKLPAELAAELVRIHRITPHNAHQPPLPVPQPSVIDVALTLGRTALDRLIEPHPALELGLRWLEKHAPSNRPVTLVHGDFRTGNFMVTPDGLSGVLDWEFAHFGDPLEDVAWLCLRDWRFGRVNQPVGGFAARETFYQAYEVAGGELIDPLLVHYWEVFGNFNWARGAVEQAERHLSGADRSIELAAIGRRVPEMAYEMMRLIEDGPSPRAS